MRCYGFKAVLFFAITGIALGGCAQTFQNAPDAENAGASAAKGAAAKGAGARGAGVKGRAASGTGRPVIRARPKTSPGPADPARALDSAVGPLARADDGHVAVAVQDLATGTQASYDGTEGFDTASIEKADILATRLYQEQREGEPGLSPGERELAYAMITRSDNNAASALWDDADGTAGVTEANRAFGLRETTAGSGGYWGLTRTTADDQLRVLRQLLTGKSVLKPDARAYARGLMSEVEADQRWGVPAAADRGTPVVVKNGWLPNPDLWVINSIGEITSHGQRLLVSVLSDDNASEASGIDVVQRVAGKAAAALTSPA